MAEASTWNETPEEKAVHAAEFWGGAEIVDVPMSHNEPVPYLRDYIREVIDDLQE